MTENYRALTVILALAMPSFLALQRPLVAAGMARGDFRLRLGLWLTLTAALFLAGSFWLFALVATLALLFAAARDSNRLALYAFVMLVAPPFQASVEGFGGINKFLELDYLRLLSLVVLLPIALACTQRAENARWFSVPSDKYLLGYLVLQTIVQAQVTTTTDLIRSVCILLIDVVLPYYAFSRGLTDMRRMQDVFASFVAACAVMAVLGVFELLKGWLLYSSLPAFLGLRWGYGHYLGRDGSLRATVSTGHSIVFGYAMTVALGFHLAILPLFRAIPGWWRGMAWMLFAGLLVSLSRGPWVGALAMAATAIAFSPRPGRRVATIVVAAAVGVPLLSLTPYGSKIVALLPFVGTVDVETVTYRQELFNVAWRVVMLNPFFGSPYAVSTGALEQMRQGEGIIDIVNTYVGIALMTGLVGMSLFLLVFASNGVRLVRSLLRHNDKMSDQYALGRGLLAATVGVLTIIATASSINAIPVIYWCLAGSCAAWVWSARGVRHDVAALRSRRPAGLGSPSW